MSLAEIRDRARTAARETSERLRANASSDHPLPFEARREVADLLHRGHPHMAALALDEALAEQATS